MSHHRSRRLRKKLHIDEFQELGFEVAFRLRDGLSADEMGAFWDAFIGDAIEGQYVANNLHFAAAIAFILMLILLAAMALMKRGTNKRVYGGV